jgi:uncharacterized membrane protein YcjF (UPF0283 family)
MAESLTDRVYRTAERFEARRWRMRAIVVLGFALSSISVSLSAWSYLVAVHQKGPSVHYIFLLTSGVILGVLLISVCLKRYRRIRRCEGCLAELERLEETVYREVFGSR